MIYLAVAGLILFAVGLRVFNTLWVYKECDYRETDSKKLWTIFTACIGFIGAVTFACFVPKSKNKSNKKMSVASVVIFSAIIIGCVLYTCFFVIPAYNDYEIEEQSSFNYDDVTYKDENGNEIIYDKMGISYTFDEYIEGYRWYDRDGSSYVAILDESECQIGFKCVESGEEFTDGVLGEYSCYIDKEGYLCIFDFYDNNLCIYMPDDIGDAVYFDNNSHLYYHPDDVSYDKGGNIVFSDYYFLKDLKYSDIPEEEFEYFSYMD